MAKLLISTFLLALVNARFASGPCPKVQIKQNFDESRYLGLWYEQVRNNDLWFQSGECSQQLLQHNPGDQYIKVTNSEFRDDGKWASINGSAYCENGTAKCNVHFGGPMWGDYQVIDTDYDNYTFVYSCFDLYFFHTDAIWFMTRSPEKDSSKFKFDDMLKKVDYDKKYLHFTKQKDCKPSPATQESLSKAKKQDLQQLITNFNNYSHPQNIKLRQHHSLNRKKNTELHPTNKKMDAKPILGYWNCRGRGHPCRLLLNHLNIDFTDRRYQPKQVDGQWDVSEWFNEKFNIGLDFPNLPYYKDGSLNATETPCILQTICQLYRHEYLGRNAEQVRKVIQIGYIIKEYDSKLVTASYTPNFGPDGRAGIRTFIEQNLTRIAAYMKDNALLCGDLPTWPDFQFLELLNLTDLFEAGLADSISPKFRRFRHTMLSLENVDRFWQETADMKVNNVFAHLNN